MHSCAPIVPSLSCALCIFHSILANFSYASLTLLCIDSSEKSLIRQKSGLFRLFPTQMPLSRGHITFGRLCLFTQFWKFKGIFFSLVLLFSFLWCVCFCFSILVVLSIFGDLWGFEVSLIYFCSSLLRARFPGSQNPYGHSTSHYHLSLIVVLSHTLRSTFPMFAHLKCIIVLPHYIFSWWFCFFLKWKKKWSDVKFLI